MSRMSFAIAFCLAIVFSGCVPEDEGRTTIDLEQYVYETIVVQGDEDLIIGSIVSFADSAALVLEPGARVLIQSDDVLNLNGGLFVNGTSDRGCTISSDSPETIGTIWVRDSAIVSYCTFRNLSNGMIFNGGSVQVSNTTIMDCETGFNIGDSNVEITDVDVENVIDGIVVGSSDAYLNQVQVRSCETGLSVNASVGTIEYCSISDCVTGIDSRGYSEVDLEYTEIRSCDAGIYYFYGEPVIHNCLFSDNQKHIFLSAYPRHDVDIHENDFLDFVEYTVYIFPREWANIHSIDIGNNYWNGLDSLAIAESILDGYDVDPSDTLHFQPVSDTPFFTTH